MLCNSLLWRVLSINFGTWSKPMPKDIESRGWGFKGKLKLYFPSFSLKGAMGYLFLFVFQ